MNPRRREILRRRHARQLADRVEGLENFDAATVQIAQVVPPVAAQFGRVIGRQQARPSPAWKRS